MNISQLGLPGARVCPHELSLTGGQSPEVQGAPETGPSQPGPLSHVPLRESGGHTGPVSASVKWARPYQPCGVVWGSHRCRDRAPHADIPQAPMCAGTGVGTALRRGRLVPIGIRRGGPEMVGSLCFMSPGSLVPWFLHRDPVQTSCGAPAIL